jgi:DNA-binding MarR family transcriptional regulator
VAQFSGSSEERARFPGRIQKIYLALLLTLVKNLGMPSRDARAPSRSRGPTVEEAHAGIEVLARLSELYRERRAQLAAGVGLTDQQWEVLEQIATEHFMPSLFAKHRESSAAAVSKILRQVTEAGLVVVAVGKDDARKRTYSLTAKGRRVMEALREGREDAIRKVWLALPGDGLEAFTELGSELVERLTRYAAEQGNERK